MWDAERRLQGKPYRPARPKGEHPNALVRFARANTVGEAPKRKVRTHPVGAAAAGPQGPAFPLSSREAFARPKPLLAPHGRGLPVKGSGTNVAGPRLAIG